MASRRKVYLEKVKSIFFLEFSEGKLGGLRKWELFGAECVVPSVEAGDSSEHEWPRWLEEAGNGGARTHHDH